MGRVKELFMAEHEELIERYLREHPGATDEEAVDATADLAYEHAGDRMEAIADAAHEHWKTRREEENG